ncbi:MAG: nucleoside triphosphate pyrophosphatase [Xanthomonadales bacterium]|jgi:MAF protein|nr:nucleoside triphosphate pyrophosphatase [Xanthomonadales bacterium]
MQPQSHTKKLILASTSPYRKIMLERFPLEFGTVAPEADETARPGELPSALVRRLALAKARAVSRTNPAAVVIGSDQVAEHEGRIVGKPGSLENASRQLAAFSGRTVNFLSAFTLVCEDEKFLYERTVITEVVFRELKDDEIQRYLALDRPFDCAGSFRSEANGPALLTRMSSTDPTAIMGLPMIELAAGLRMAGYALP